MITNLGKKWERKVLNIFSKGENVLVDDQNRVYVTSGDAYGHEEGYGGVVYRVSER